MNNSEIIQPMTSHQKLAVINVDAIEIDLSELSLSEIELIEQHNALPLFKFHESLFIAVSNLSLPSGLTNILNIPIEAVFVDREAINRKDFTIRYDTARLARLLNHNKTAGMMLAKWLANFDMRATDCSLKQIDKPYFRKWKFWWAIANGITPIMDITFATLEQKVVREEYDNLQDGLRQLVIDEPIYITSETEAISYIYFFFSFSATGVQVISPENIIYFNILDEKRWQKIAQQLTEPQAKQQKNDYVVSLWLTKGTDLYQGIFTIDKQGAIVSSLKFIEPRIVYSYFSDDFLE